MINKIMITNEARFDYEEIVCKKKHSMPTNQYKYDIEEHFDNFFPIENYFSKKYYDEKIEILLLLFFRKGMKFGPIQTWVLVGICDSKDYSEDIEEKGLIKNWLDNYIVAWFLLYMWGDILR